MEFTPANCVLHELACSWDDRSMWASFDRETDVSRSCTRVSIFLMDIVYGRHICKECEVIITRNKSRICKACTPKVIDKLLDASSQRQAMYLS